MVLFPEFIDYWILEYFLPLILYELVSVCGFCLVGWEIIWAHSGSYILLGF